MRKTILAVLAAAISVVVTASAASANPVFCLLGWQHC